jgi:hypothetical protein
MAVYLKNHLKDINAICGQIFKVLNVRESDARTHAQQFFESRQNW